jgi:DNA-binding response OmpR family regulator
MKLLIVEDEKDLSESICEYLNSELFICETAMDFNEAFDKIYMNDYACIILDITLPNGSGLDLLKEIKKQNKEDGILIISARNSLGDKIDGLNLGADDYLPKPFHLAELGARVAAIIRRKSFNGKNRMILDELTLDLQDRSVKIGDTAMNLTRKEYELLLYFITNKNRVVTKESIAEHLWGDSMDLNDNFDFIYSHVKNLRRKMAQAGSPEYIKAMYGIGYKFTIPS